MKNYYLRVLDQGEFLEIPGYQQPEEAEEVPEPGASVRTLFELLGYNERNFEVEAVHTTFRGTIPQVCITSEQNGKLAEDIRKYWKAHPSSA